MRLELLVLLCLLWAAPVAAQLTRIAVISDLNGRYGTVGYDKRVALAVARIIELRADLVLCSGDMVAGQQASPALTASQLSQMWDAFDAVVARPLEAAGIPLVVAPGNHDASAYPQFAAEREFYRQRWATVDPRLKLVGSAEYPLHYAVEFEGLLVIALDATTTGQLNLGQHQWLNNLLSERPADRARLMLGHLPLQPIATGREREVLNDPILEALMASHDIDAYLSGHHHSYYPGVRQGLRMLSVGNLGGNVRTLTGTFVRSGHSFSWLEIDAAGAIAVRAWTGSGFDQELPLAQLPAELGTGRGRLIREDLATANLPVSLSHSRPPTRSARQTR